MAISFKEIVSYTSWGFPLTKDEREVGDQVIQNKNGVDIIVVDNSSWGANARHEIAADFRYYGYNTEYDFKGCLVSSTSDKLKPCSVYKDGKQPAWSADGRGVFFWGRIVFDDRIVDSLPVFYDTYLKNLVRRYATAIASDLGDECTYIRGHMMKAFGKPFGK